MGLMERFYIRKRANADLQGIIDNLNVMLNTKKTFGAWVKEYGIGDFNAYRARHKIVETIIEEIKENVQLFESRVIIHDIHEVDANNPFRVRLEVKCAFLRHDKPLYIIVDSLTDQVFLDD
ncbi:GPW/gp25 family protein [Planctomycetota bacterium]